MSESNLREMTAEEYTNEVHALNKHALVAFVAPWCQYCEDLQPSLHGISMQYVHWDTAVFRIDADKYPELVQKLELKGVPTLFFFKNGVKVLEVTGSLSQNHLRQYVSHMINKC
jgi:thioredoxin 1